jgi:hypothetical protein
VNENQQLADLDHLLGIDIMGGLDDDEERLAVALDLRPLVGLDRVLDSQLVQVELAGDRLELLCCGFDHPEPNEGAILPCRFAGIVQAQAAVAASALLVDGAVGDHGKKYRPQLGYAAKR